MIEIKFRGRGGQGAVVASEILGRAFFMEGKYPQCFSLFGGERRGAPVTSFLRVDDQPILLKCQIRNPDHIILFDLSLTNELEIGKELKPHGMILINTERKVDSFPQLRRFRMGLVDASSIAREMGLGDIFNMAMLGAYIRFFPGVKMETLIEAVKKEVPSKGEENIRALKEAYERVIIYEATG